MGKEGGNDEALGGFLEKVCVQKQLEIDCFSSQLDVESHEFSCLTYTESAIHGLFLTVQL